MKMNIRKKIVIMLIILIILPMLAMGLRSTGFTQEKMIELYVSAMQEVNKDSAVALENVLEGNARALKILASDVNIKNIVVNPSLEPGLREDLDAYRDMNPDILNVYVGTRNKNMYLSPITTALPDGYDPTSRDWYKSAEVSDEVIWTDPYIDAGTGKTVITAALKLPTSTDGMSAGVVAIDLQLDYFSELVSQIKIGRTGQGEAYIISNDGMIFAHPNQDMIGKHIKDIGFTDETLKTYFETGSGYLDYTDETTNDKRFAAYHKFTNADWMFISTVSYKEINEISEKMALDTIIIGVVSIVIASLIGLLVTGFIVKELKNLEKRMKLVAAGDFTVVMDVKSHDEIGSLGKSFNTMIAQVKELIERTIVVSDKLLTSSENIAALSQQASVASLEVSNAVDEIARGAVAQAQETEEGAQIANALSEKFDGLAQSNKEMNKNAQNTLETNKEGIKTLEELRQASRVSLESNDRVEKAIVDLDKSATSINAILETITSIASQTNLLALNASIEAARAGEAGRGFAVVAEEIRKLAEGSDSAAQEIKIILDKIQSESKHTVDIMKEVKGVYSEQEISVEKVNAAFGEISSSIGKVAEKIDEMTSQVSNLTGEKDKIVETMERISSISEETAASSEEVTASMHQKTDAIEEVAKNASGLTELAGDLMRNLSNFKIK